MFDGEKETLTLLSNFCPSFLFLSRAFFRRIHKVSKESPSLHCKSNGTCEVSVRTRSRCQNCRYSKCVQAGMKPEYVLNEEERKHRFKKDPASSGASEVNDRFSLDEEAPQLCGDKRSCSSSVKRFSGGAQCQHQGVSGIASSSFQPKIWSFHHGIVVEDDSARTVWKECYKEHTIETAFLKDLIKFHRGDSDLLYHPLLWRHLLKLGTLFERYAARDQALGLISSRDRKKLLHFNKLLFIQFILSQYVSAPTGVSQIEWLLLAQVPDFSCTEEEKRQLKRKPIKDLKLIFFEDRYKVSDRGRPRLLLYCNCDGSN